MPAFVCALGLSKMFILLGHAPGRADDKSAREFAGPYLPLRFLANADLMHDC